MSVNVCSATNRFTINNPTTKRTLNLTKDTSSSWIYCNYPESISSDALGDYNLGNKCLNQVTVGAGKHNIFYSYYNVDRTTGTYRNNNAQRFGIQVFNPNAYAITLTVSRTGHHNGNTPDPLVSGSSGFDATAGVPWREYFNSTATTRSLGANQSAWICDESIPQYDNEWTHSNAWMATAFSGLAEFTVSGAAVVSVYAYNNKNMINGTATIYSNDNAYPGVTLQYSGYAPYSAYTTATRMELKATDIMNGSIYFNTNYPYADGTGISNFTINGVTASPDSDSIPITCSKDGSVVAPGVPNENLGNWGTIYKIDLRLRNDTSEAQTFYGYILNATANNDQFPIIKTDAGFDYTRINNDPAGENGPNSWRWMETIVPANSYSDVTYYYVLGTNSTHALRHVFSLKWWDADLSPR